LFGLGNINMFSLKKKIKKSEFASLIYNIIIKDRKKSSVELKLTREQEDFLYLSCIAKTFEKYNLDKDLIGYVVTFFIKENNFTNKLKGAEDDDFYINMLYVLDKIEKINDFYGSRHTEQELDWTRRQLLESSPLIEETSKDKGIEFIMIPIIYVNKLKVVDTCVRDLLNRAKIIDN
jgi:hypothetical protein